MDYSEVSLQKHREWGGKIDYAAKMPIRSKEDLSIAYTPGVAKPCMVIHDEPEKSYELTGRHNLVAVIIRNALRNYAWSVCPERREQQEAA